jgi:uncharacterized membrane protein YeaQ/YmgE (transglycosylase-associated protein family)
VKQVSVPGPSIVFSFIVATLYGSSYHVLTGGDARRLALYLLAGWIGYALGQIIGDVLDITLLSIGAVHFFTATVGAWVALIIVWFVTQNQPEY